MLQREQVPTRRCMARGSATRQARDRRDQVHGGHRLVRRASPAATASRRVYEDLAETAERSIVTVLAVMYRQFHRPYRRR